MTSPIHKNGGLHRHPHRPPPAQTLVPQHMHPPHSPPAPSEVVRGLNFSAMMVTWKPRFCIASADASPLAPAPITATRGCSRPDIALCRCFADEKSATFKQNHPSGTFPSPSSPPAAPVTGHGQARPQQHGQCRLHLPRAPPGRRYAACCPLSPTSPLSPRLASPRLSSACFLSAPQPRAATARRAGAPARTRSRTLTAAHSPCSPAATPS